MRSATDDWHYSIRGLAKISKESPDGISSGLKELEAAGYLTRRQLRGERGRMGETEYTIYEEPRAPCQDSPCTENPVTVKPDTASPCTDGPCSEKITFYVAECMEFPELGEFHENLTLPEAFAIYDSIPAERMHGVKGIGFDLRDGSIYEGQFPLMEAGKLSADSIDLVEHYRESPLVQQAVAGCRSLLEEKEQQAVLDAADGPRTPGMKKEERKSVLADLRDKKSRVHGVNAPKEQNRSKREEMEQA